MSDREKDRKKAQDASKQPTFEELRSELVNQVKNFPIRSGKDLTEKEQAKLRKKKLEQLQEETKKEKAEESKAETLNLEDGGQVIRKRDEKAKDKREHAVEKMIKENKDATKN